MVGEGGEGEERREGKGRHGGSAKGVRGQGEEQGGLKSRAGRGGVQEGRQGEVQRGLRGGGPGAQGGGIGGGKRYLSWLDRLSKNIKNISFDAAWCYAG